MGGADAPYLYDPPSSRRIAYPYSDFNPKAVTEASYKRLSQQTTNTSSTRPDGPLINFNKHPDSYEVVLGQPIDHKPMPAGTKTTVVALRWIQFALRVITEVGALGLLVATILIKDTSGSETYLLRVPQAWDSLIGIYAIYHLVRPAKSRLPGSAYSYHMFALIMDVGLIPLYVYIAMATWNNYHLAVETNASGASIDGRWSTFFSTLKDTNLVMFVTFIAACVMAGLHFFSIGIDIWLVILFRKISKLPPDMNPLEDNLTSRRATKHKHKNSEMTVGSNMSEVDRKKLAHLSGSTLFVGNESRTSMLKEPEARVVPFGHSRTGSSNNLVFSPHNPESARWSRHQFDGQQVVYQEAVSSPRSRYEVRPDGKLDVRTRRGSQSPSKRSSVISTLNINAGPNGAMSRESVVLDEIPDSPTTTYRTARSGSPAAPNAAPTQDAIKSQQRDTLLNDNWYVLEDDVSDMGYPSRHHTPALDPPLPPGRYHAISPPPPERHDSFEPNTVSIPPKPLAMNPPTPPMFNSEEYPDPAEFENNDVGRTMTAGSSATLSSSVYSESAPSLKSSKNVGGHRSSTPGTPKGRYYGDLAAAQRGVRGSTPATIGGYALPPSPDPSRTPSPEKKGRVISRSGADIADEAVLYVSEGRYSMRSRRDVSGKIAEEGRGGSRPSSWGRSR